MPHATRDDLTLYYEQAGRGDPPLLFVHGWCCDHTFFAPQFDHFKATNTVVAVDLRGCGGSDRPADGYELTGLVDDLVWLCDEIGVTSPIVVGHSLGGMIAIELAARHPSVPLAVAAIDPGPIDFLPEAREVFEHFAAELDGPAGEAARRAWVEDMVIDDAELRRWIVEKMCAVPLSVAAAVIHGVLNWDGPAALAACAVPAVVVRSSTGGSNEPARLLALKPDLHIGVTVGAGHFHQLEVPEQVTPMIERFLQVAIPRNSSAGR